MLSIPNYGQGRSSTLLKINHEELCGGDPLDWGDTPHPKLLWYLRGVYWYLIILFIESLLKEY